MRPRTSPIWNYFVEISISSAKCMICNKIYSRKGRTTTALKSHLRALHVEKYAEFEMLDEAVKVSLEAKKQEFSFSQEVKKPSYKYCMVPKCKNTVISTPDKWVFRIPRDAKVRNNWCKMMRRDNVSPLSVIFCCEDHFNVEEDMENYLKFKLVGGPLKLKEGVLPHKFECQQNKETDITNSRKRLVLSKDVGQGDLLLHPVEVELENQDSNSAHSNDPLNISEEIDVVLNKNVKGQKTKAIKGKIKPKMETKSTDTPCTSKQNIKKRSSCNLDQQSFTGSYATDTFYASDNDSSDVETKQAMNFRAGELQILEVEEMKNEESIDEESEEDNGEEEKTFTRPLIEYSYEEERPVKKRRLINHKEDYHPRKMFLLSILPDIQAFSDAEMSTFRKDVILSIDKIINTRKRSK